MEQIPTSADFAVEVRTERLRVLIRITMVAAVAALVLLFFLASLQIDFLLPWFGGVMFLLLGSVLTFTLLRRGAFDAAVWMYGVTGVVAVALVLASPNPVVRQVIPFAFPIVVFIVGLMLSPAATVGLALVTVALTLGIPVVVEGGLSGIGVHQVVASVVTLIGAGLASQVTGEMYQITEWALMNYQRERRVAQELFENRAELEKSLLRSRSLSERLQETNEELVEARNAAEAAKHFRGQFLANMSHELRTPLNAIIGFSETMLHFPMMYDEVKLPETYRSDMEQIHRSGTQLLGVINDILDLSRVDAGRLEIKMEAVPLEGVILDVVMTANGLVAKKPIELKTDLPNDMPVVWADEQRLRQVLLNLYSNAAKFTMQGSITLAVAVLNENEVQISVTDTGSGIDKNSLEVIFEEFRQAQVEGRDPRSGAGLGLAISRQLLRLMGGRIWAESEPGVGSTFHVIVQIYRGQSDMEDIVEEVTQAADAIGDAAKIEAMEPQAVSGSQAEPVEAAEGEART